MRVRIRRCQFRVKGRRGGDGECWNGIRACYWSCCVVWRVVVVLDVE
jgi:hypothetical protein